MTSQAPAAPDDNASDDDVVPYPTDEADDQVSVPTASGLTATSMVGAGAPVELGGRQGPDPTRYGDWEMRGRCIDF